MVVKPELKFKDTVVDFGGTAIPNTGSTGYSINLLTAGNTPSTIVGRKIVMRRITLKGVVTLPPSSNATLNSVRSGEIVRILLVRDKQTNGAQAIVSDVIGTAATVNGLVNMENSERFTIIKEWLIETGVDTNHDGTNYFNGYEVCPFKWSKKMFTTVTYDNAPSSSITDIRDNNFFIVAISQFGVATCTINARIRYSDV